VGDQQAYTDYRRLALQKEIADEHLRAAEDEEATIMSWGSWGRWSW
jgi:hypothetical protein